MLSDANYRILREPKKTKILMILTLFSKGYKNPLIIPILLVINQPMKLIILMLLTQKENFQHYPYIPFAHVQSVQTNLSGYNNSNKEADTQIAHII